MCGALQAGLALATAAAGAIWFAALAAYVGLLRRMRGGWATVTSSMWLLKAGSLGEGAEPLRRRLLLLFLAFLVLVLAAAVGSAAAVATC